MADYFSPIELESDIESYFRRKVKQIGGIIRKHITPGHTGAADRYVLFKPAIIYFVELKRATGVLSPQQEHTINLFHSYGFVTRVLYSKPQVDKFIQEALHEINKRTVARAKANKLD